LKKSICFGLTLLFACNCIFAEINGMPFEIGKIDVTVNQSANLAQINVNESIDQSYDLAFQNKAKTYEIRMLEFKKKSGTFSKKELESGFSVFTKMVVLNMVEDENAIMRIKQFDSVGVKDENNGDIGYVVFVKYNNKQSNFYNGYNFAIINCFLNYDKGIIITTIMFNSTDVMSDKNYSNDFKIFKF
jgi:hypothetical protein